MRVLVGVCGGVAAYKAAEVVRELQRCGAEVEVAMTAGAERFVTPLTFAALTGHPVYTYLWQPSGERTNGSSSRFEIEHIAVGQHLDAIVIAPATANILAKLAHGLADDFLTTLCLASRAPLFLAPAMNVQMWQNPATQHNVHTLVERGANLISPDDGYLACGMVGGGRLAPVEAIASAVMRARMQRSELLGETVLITAGGTREPIDPVRFIGNRSSGKMGHALAEAAIARGARVHLVTASPLAAPVNCAVERVSTSEEMSRAVFSRLAEATIVIGAAAVSDFRVREIALQKLRRTGLITLELETTKDIIADVALRCGRGTTVVGFAAETEDLEQNGREKLIRKGVDAIVANDVSDHRTGFDAERNAGLFITKEDTVRLPESSKRVMADAVLAEITALRERSKQTAT